MRLLDLLRWSLLVAVIALAWAPTESAAKGGKKPPTTVQKVQSWHNESKQSIVQAKSEPVEHLSGTRGMVVMAELFEDVARSAQAMSFGNTGIGPLDRFIQEASNARPIPTTLDAIMHAPTSPSHASTHQSTTERLYRVASAVVGKQKSFQPVQVIALAKVAVKPFAQGFIRGALRPGHYLHEERMRPAPTSRNASIVLRWLATPNEKRIFVTGERGDESTARLLKRILSSKGFEVFFYLDCSPLCAPETVGAMFNSSGAIFHIESRKQTSQYLPIEIMIIAAMQRRSGEIEVQPPARSSPGRIVVYEPGILIQAEGLDRSVMQALVFDCVSPDSKPTAGLCR